MTRYEKAIQTIEQMERAIRNITLAANLDHDSKNDKASLYVHFGVNTYDNPRRTENWGEAEMYLHMSYGWYGSSSGYSVTEGLAPMLIRDAINMKSREIAELAVELARGAIKQAAQEAKSEAEGLLAKLDDK